MYGVSRRLTRKPGALRHGKGNLPMRVTNDIAANIVCSSVCSPRMTSTSGRLATGLKKCSPTNRLGRVNDSASVSNWMLDVFVAINAWSCNRGSKSPNSERLASAFSMMASMTRSAEPISAALKSTRRRFAAASASPGARSRLRNSSCARASAGSTYCCARSCNVTSSPFSAHQAAMSPPIVPAPTT